MGSDIAPSPEVGGTDKRTTEKEQCGGSQDADGSDERDKEIEEANDVVGEEDTDQFTVGGVDDTGQRRDEEHQSRTKSTRSRKRLLDNATRGGRAKPSRRGVPTSQDGNEGDGHEEPEGNREVRKEGSQPTPARDHRYDGDGKVIVTIAHEGEGEDAEGRVMEDEEPESNDGVEERKSVVREESDWNLKANNMSPSSRSAMIISSPARLRSQACSPICPA